MSSLPTTSETLEQRRNPDERALADIYDEYHDRIYRYVYRQVGEVDTARDLTADVFQRLLQAYHLGGGPDRHLSAWLYRSAHNAVVDFYRRQALRQHLPLDETLVDGDADPTAAVEQRLAVSRVRTALRELSLEQKDVIVLKFLEGMSNKEVAEALDKTVGAVKSLQHRALGALQRLLAEDEEERR